MEERREGEEIEEEIEEKPVIRIHTDYPHPVTEIEVEQGVNEDGGGFKIRVRMDGEDPETLLNIALTLLEKVNGKGKEKKEDSREVV